MSYDESLKFFRLNIRIAREVRRDFFDILHSSFFINNFLTIFYGILYFFTLEVRHLGKNQYIKKILRTSYSLPNNMLLEIYLQERGIQIQM